MTEAAIPARRARRRSPAQVGNVVPFHAPKETTDDIVRDVQERSRRQEGLILTKLQELNAEVDRQHTERARECLTIGYSMCRTTLDDWIEIGERMLAGKAGRR